MTTPASLVWYIAWSREIEIRRAVERRLASANLRRRTPRRTKDASQPASQGPADDAASLVAVSPALSARPGLHPRDPIRTSVDATPSGSAR